jgi:hypothetical protein
VDEPVFVAEPSFEKVSEADRWDWVTEIDSVAVALADGKTVCDLEKVCETVGWTVVDNVRSEIVKELLVSVVDSVSEKVAETVRVAVGDPTEADSVVAEVIDLLEVIAADLVDELVDEGP